MWSNWPRHRPKLRRYYKSTVWDRAFSLSLTEGPSKGTLVPIRQLVQDYDALRGRDERGRAPEAQES